LVSVEVEWFNHEGVSRALRDMQIGGFKQRTWISGGLDSVDTDFKPFYWADRAEISDTIGGYARVHADDPRIMVAAFQYCRAAKGSDKSIMSITHIPSYSVGTTADYFVAAAPATLPHPAVEPEFPN
jgi:hypothetical protein